MAKKVKKSVSILSVVFFLFGISFLQAFEWPQEPIQAQSHFSEMRGDGFNTSFAFSAPGEVSVAEEGQIVMTINNNQSNMGWFESPLGNTVIVAHKNDMLSVYSNLINVRVNESKRDVHIGDIIGVSGQSAWMQGNEGLGFQIIDTKMKTLINPAVLMQEVSQSSRVSVQGTTAINRSGEQFSLYNGASLRAGVYTLYMERPETGMIHTCSVTLNGEIKETTSYDTIGQVDSSLVVYGNKSYRYDEIYPEENMMRLAELLLSRGTNAIEISLSNAGGTQSYARYRISVN